MQRPELGQWLVALPFLALSGWSLLAWGQRIELHCERQGEAIARCTLTSASLLDTQLRRFDGTALATARIEEQTSTDANGNDSTTRRLVLQLDDGVLPLSSFGSGGSDAMLAHIQAYDRNRSEPVLELSADNRWLAYPLALLWLLAGAWILVPEGLDALWRRWF